MSSDYAIISADSHVCEPEAAFADIDPKFRDTAPKLIHEQSIGAGMWLEGLPYPIPLGIVCAAGEAAADIPKPKTWEQLHRGGWDPAARLGEQDRDGVAAEVLYPSVGMVLCFHPDIDYKVACAAAYNRWLTEYCATSPERLIGVGMAMVKTIEAGIGEVEAIHGLGLKGVMLPGTPEIADYDDECYNPLWEKCIELGLPVSFHILTDKAGGGAARGPDICRFMSIIRANQDIMAMLVFAGVFERYPELKVVCVEADAGWVPHFVYRMDHAFERHRYWMKAGPLKRMPGEYFRDNIYLTFQDDYVAGRFASECNIDRLMWANDFPHSDSTWPDSAGVLARLTAGLDAVARRKLLHDNVAGLYGLTV